MREGWMSIDMTKFKIVISPGGNYLLFEIATDKNYVFFWFFPNHHRLPPHIKSIAIENGVRAWARQNRSTDMGDQFEEGSVKKTY